jgi:peptide/nickel transport system permease protein
MLRYAVIRLLWLIPILICVSLIIFVLMDAAPGSIIDSMINEEMTQEDIEELKREYDLDKSVFYRYGKYMLGLFRGNLGSSEISGLSVFDMYKTRFPKTLELSLLSLVLGTLIAIPMGIFAAKHAGTIWDNLTTAFTLIGLSMPSFWLGLLLLIWFSHSIKLFPAGYDGTWKCYVMPVIAGGFSMSASITRQTRSAILDVVRQDYLRTARAKGVPEWRVTVKHELRNAWIPIVTQIGMMLAMTMAGSAVIEAVYSWPGVGRLMIEAINQRDTTLACGCVILTATLYVVLLLLVDIVYAFIDPRIRAQYSAGRRKKRRAEA